MRLEILLEEESAEAALATLMPGILGPQANIEVSFHRFRGKHDLLKKLPSRLRGYRQWIREADVRLMILIDQDKQDCVELKAALEKSVAEAGLSTLRTCEDRSQALVATRIAVEELEAWFFGDMAAVAGAYSKVDPGLAQKARYRRPDAIRDPAEALERVLQGRGYHTAGLRKVTAAGAIAAHMLVERNVSPSFQVFVAGIRTLTGASGAQA